MDVILLERMENLGQMGDTVTVKNGYARNYLLPQQKALRATKDNVAYFETQRQQLEAQDLKRKQDAEKVAKKLEGFEVVLIRQAGDTGQLYGSVRSRDIQEAMIEKGVTVERSQIAINTPIKTIGIFPISVSLHADVSVEIKVNIAKSDAEADQQRVDSEFVQDVAEDVQKMDEIHTGEDKPEEAEAANDDETPKEAKEENAEASAEAEMAEAPDAEEADSESKATESEEKADS